MVWLRHVLPAAVCLVAVVIVAVDGFTDDALDGAAVFLGAGLSIWLMNLLFRVGVGNERDRDAEQAARDYFDEHGHWPDEVPPPR